MESAFCCLLVIFSIFQGNVASKGEWHYDGEKGVKHWQSLFPAGCAGRQQSPIDISTHCTQYDPNLNDFAIWHDPPMPGSKFQVLNNGHSITVNTIGTFKVANGGLPSVYSTAQFHFHWGHANHQGSEHTVDSQASPLELHVVNYDSVKYSSLPFAMVEPMGLAVLGVMYEIGESDNENLEPIIQALKHVQDPETSDGYEIPAQRIRNFLPEDTSQYYRYNGSLTTPGCFESVIWTVFKQPQYISHRQMMEFRKVLQKVRHNHHGKKHKRSATKEEKAVREVMEEAGIADESLQKMELEIALEEKQTEGPQLGEPPKKFYLHHGENPDETNLKKVNQSSTEKQLETLVMELEHENEELVQEVARLKLVNNFRPVQPLNGRTVYRSFPSVKPDPSESNTANRASLTKDPNNKAGVIASSWSILILTVIVVLFL